MELIPGFRRFFLCVWLISLTGSANAQASGGVAIGMGLGGDLMVDSTFGEVPNPLMGLTSQGGQQHTGTGSQAAAPPNIISATGGGFNAQGFPTLGSDLSSLFPIDPSRIVGVANGQTIHLPGFFSNQLQSGSRVVLPAESSSTSTQQVDTNQQYMLRNEDFTALGNVGHLVRVPVSEASPSNTATGHSVTTNNASSSSDTSISSSMASDGTIAIDPNDIIGVADMNMLGPDGNPQFFSFNPGTGHASEISALQSAMLGTAVDMTGMLPPPFDTIAASADQIGVPNFSINTASNSTSEVSGSNTVTVENLASEVTSTNQKKPTNNINMPQGFNNVQTGSNLFGLNSMIAGEGSLTNINEQSMFNTGALSMPNSIDQSLLNTGSITNDIGFNEQIMFGANDQNMLNTGSASSSNNIFNTLEQSMFDTAATGEQSIFNTGSANSVNDVNAKTPLNTLEQSMFDTAATGEQPFFNTGSANTVNDVNAKTAFNTLEQSMFDTTATGGQSIFNTGSANSVNDVNAKTPFNTLEQSMFDTTATGGQSIFNTGSANSVNDVNAKTPFNTLEQSMFDTTVTGGQSIFNTGSANSVNDVNAKTAFNTLEQSMFDTAATGEQSNFNTGSSNSVNDVNANVAAFNTLEQSMFDTAATGEHSNFNTGSSNSVNDVNANVAAFNTLEQSMFDKALASEQSILKTGSTTNINDAKARTEHNNFEQAMLNSGAIGNKATDQLLTNNNILSSNTGAIVNGLTGQSIDSVISNEVMSSTNEQTKSNSISVTSDQSNLDMFMPSSSIIIRDQLSNNVLTDIQSNPSADAKLFNVDATLGVSRGQSSTDATSVGGLFGVIDSRRDRQNGGLTGSRFSGMNVPLRTGTEMGIGDSYKTESGVAQSVGMKTEPSRIDSNVVITQPFASGKSTLSRAGETMSENTLSNTISATNSLSSVSDSSSTLTAQNTRNKIGVSTQGVPHVSDLTTEGLYPFEGSFSARDATLTEGSPVIVDMNSVLQGHEPLHLEPTITLAREVNTGITPVSKTNNAILRDSNIGTDVTVDITNQGTESITSSDALAIKIGTFPETTSLNQRAFGNVLSKATTGASFVNSGQNSNSLAIDKINEYVGIDNTRTTDQRNVGGNAISIDLLDANQRSKDNMAKTATENKILSTITNSGNVQTEGDQSILNASNVYLTSLNDNTQGLLVAGNNNKDINTFNKYELSSKAANTKLTTATDGVNVAMSGFSGAPITNMLGVIPGKTTGGLVVSGYNVPPYKSTSTTSNEFSSMSTKDITSGSTDNAGFPSGSFVIGAGQPNSKIISTGRLDAASLTANVGGVAIGSSHKSGLLSITLPSSAFKSSDKLHQDRLQTSKQEKLKAVKVDMSNFIPPPYEDPNKSQSNFQTSSRVGSTKDLIQKAINRQTRNNPISNILVSDSGSALTSQSNIFENSLAASNQDITSGKTMNNADVSGRFLSNQDSSVKNRQSLVGTSSVQTLQEGATTKESVGNFGNDVTNRKTRNDRFNNRVDLNPQTPFSLRVKNNLNDQVASNQDSFSAGRVSVTGLASTDAKTSTDQTLSNIVMSNEHFGKVPKTNITPRISTESKTSGQTSIFSTGQQHAVPSVVVEHAIFTDTMKDTNANLSIGASSLAAALDIHANSNPSLVSSSMGQSLSSPLIGAIFGTGTNSTSTMTKKFLEKSGITREPAVDFMTTFLQHAKPSRPQTGGKQVHIVPLSNFSPKSQNVITGRQRDTQTVDQFGVADIYTRKQQLNPSQWRRLMSKVSHDRASNRMGIDVDYQTQNIIGAGETKPLGGNIYTGSETRLPSTLSSQMASRRLSKNTERLNTNPRFATGRQNNARSFVLFAAPGIKDAAGPQSVTIQNYKPLSVNLGSRFSTIPSSIKSSNEVGQQRLQEFVGTQATAEQTSSFTNTFNQNQQVGVSDLHVSNQNIGMSVNALNSPLKNRLSVDPHVQKDGQLGETGQKIQNEMDTFKLGRSIMISDGVIPEFTGPNSLQSLPIDTRDLQGLTVNGMRLGQPAVVSSGGSLGSVQNARSVSLESEMIPANEVTLQDIQRSANGVFGAHSDATGLVNRNIGISIGGGINRGISSMLPQSQQSTGVVDNSGILSQMQQNTGVFDTFADMSQLQQSLGLGIKHENPRLLPNRNLGIAISADLNTGLSITNEINKNVVASSIETQQGMQSAGTGVASTTDQRPANTAAILGLSAALKKQPMEQTPFTSGSRFAVFGRAGDVTGKSVGNGDLAKAIPARRLGVLGPVHDCRYKPDPTSEYYFIYKNGITQHRFRCALGTAFDEMTCECSIRISDHGDCLEVHMDFNNGDVEDSSLNRLPIGNENVEITNSTSRIPGLALYGGDSKLTIWRYQNYDFRDHVMLKVQFRPGVGGDRLQPLITNCDSSSADPSLGVVYDSMMQEVLLLLKTVNDTLKELRFKVNPDEWNDVTYIYDGQEFIGIVNGVRRYVSRENPHLLGIIGGEIKSAPTHGLVEIRDAAIVLGHCPMFGFFRGAMVDIQIYTCIPKDFRLE